MNKEKMLQLHNTFEPLLCFDNKSSHDDLINIYFSGITYLKKKYNDKSKELKSAAMVYLKLNYGKSGIFENLIENSINKFFALYNNEFNQYKSQFVVISDDDYLLLSFVYSKFK